jgi:hypothetical protein
MWTIAPDIGNLHFGRLIACSLSPDGGQLLAITNSKTVLWDVKKGVQIWRKNEEDGGRAYDWRNFVYRLEGREFPCIGLGGGAELREHPVAGRIHIDTVMHTVTVTDPVMETEETFAYQDISGDWVIASFCRAGPRLLLRSPTTCVFTCDLRPSLHHNDSQSAALYNAGVVAE